MLSSVYQTALSGMQAAELAIGVTSNNLANSMTDGFKASRVVFQDQTPQSAGNAGQVGRGVSVGAVDTDFSQGSIAISGNPFDLALEGDGFFVQQAADGELVYSRAGSFRLNADGELVSATGERVLGYNVDSNFQLDVGNLEPIKPPRGSAANGAQLTSLSVGEDGVIRGSYTDGQLRDLGQLEVANFTNPNGLIARGRNRYAAGPNSGLPTGAQARVRAGARELSNTNISRELVNLNQYSMLYRVNAHVLREASSLDEIFNLRRS